MKPGLAMFFAVALPALLPSVTATNPVAASDAAKTEEPDGARLIERVATFYAGLETVEFEALVTPEMPPDSPMGDFEIPPIRYRVTAAAPNLIALRAPDAAMETSFVQDATRQFTKIPFVRSYVLEERSDSIAELTDAPDRLMVPGVEWMLGLAHAGTVAPFEGLTAQAEGIETIDGVDCDRLRLDGPTPGRIWISRGTLPWVLRFQEDPPTEQPSLHPTDEGGGFAFRPRLDLRFSDWGIEIDPATAFAIKTPIGFDREDSVAEALLKLDGGMMGLTEPVPTSETATPAPAVDLIPMDGEPFALADLQGRVVVLDFWASWCKPCVVDLPMVLDAVNEFDPEDVTLWTVNRFESAQTIRGFMADEGFEFPVSTDLDNAIARAFKVMAIPHLVVIDRTGVIRHVHVGMAPGGKDYLRKEIEALLDR